VDVLVVNSGSSSLKVELIDLERRAARASALVERIGEPRGRWRLRLERGARPPEESERAAAFADHRAALRAIAEALRGVGAPAAVGHRVVHGGEAFSAPARVDAEVIAAIRRLVPLAPLHNPANLLGIELCLELFPALPQVAVFDTAFHQTLPPRAYRYAVPEEWYVRHGVRRYGFHGTSHAYVARRAAEHLGRPAAELRLVTLHLGNGASAAAVAGGRCVETSMGMTPLEGLVMGTRSGDLDPAVPFHVARATGLAPAEIEELLNEASGLRGLCGANDMRDVLARIDAGDPRARLALEVYCHRIRKCVGAYVAVLGGLDALVFTAGVGENAPAVRALACDGLAFLGVRLDPHRNAAAAGEMAEIHAEGAPVALLVARTHEELEIALQTEAVVGAQSSTPRS
jgi:acetate kinase